MRQLKRYLKTSAFKSKRVLLVDDEEELGWIMREIFEDAGHHLIFTSTYKQGLQEFKKSKKLDMAIIDLRLGEESGLVFVKKAKELNNKVKLIMMSAFGDPDIKNQAKELGVRHFLDKPFRTERLLNIISKDPL